MTLHWWMHWFWVTTLFTILSVCIGRASALPFDTGMLLHNTGVDFHEAVGIHEEVTLHDDEVDLRDSAVTLHNPKVTIHETEVTVHNADVNTPGSDAKLREPEVLHDSKVALHDSKVASHDSKVELHDTSRVPVPPAAGERRAKAMYIQSKPSEVSVTTPPSKLFLEGLGDRKPPTPEPTRPATNHTTLETSTRESTTPKPRDNLTKQEMSVQNTTLEDSEAVESATEQAWLLETSVSELSHPSFVEASQPEGRTGASVERDGGIQAGAVAGISLGTVALAALAGTVAFLLYRRRYLNKPQTLNDKCSNPDSSGYLDDSTVRENSEEMYSLDNDSFLNSLEAMTIQNYWTDSVKHSKL